MTIKSGLFKLSTCFAMLLSAQAFSQQTIVLEPSAKDMTPVVRNALANVKDKDLKIVFKKGTYTFLPDYAVNRYSTITNHGNGLKNVIFPLDNFDSVEIEGNNAEFIFHGRVAPFQFYNNRKITVSDITVDWDIPFTFVAEVMAVNEKEEWIDVKPWSGSHQWKLHKGEIKFPNVDGFSYPELGSTLDFNKEHKRVAHGALDRHSKPKEVEQRGNGVLRLYEKTRQFPKVGSVVTSKGDREHDRYAPAFQTKNSENVVFDNVTVHHALGMGFLFERTDGIKLLNVGVHLRDGAQRMISSTADASHFANCKGDILIDNARFENMLDDGVNVHGTYAIVDQVINSKTLRVKYGHFEQMGFEFTAKNEELWIINQPNTQRSQVNKVVSVNTLNEKYTDITFEHAFKQTVKAGDLLENKTWNPTFTLRNSVLRDHRARNVVLKTPLKTVIENNKFSSMMSSIFFRGESYFWLESGSVEDVLIQNNEFDYVAYSGMEHSVLNITPRLGKTFNQNEIYDRNIRFVNNTINTFDSRIVWADRVDGLLIKDNKITKNNDHSPIHPNAPLFEFKKSKNITLSNNSYNGKIDNFIKIDKDSASTFVDDGSIK
ncbi:alpha-1,3-galactosidase-related protein [Pseudocolwellia agarivorans]|uniref:alpha-1,3-galactosidase-related protein n=1 Tax=Pseudocolwellia agarivorans TaxID=1911682 RepID=UPI0009873ECC|nr:alpha-galactosidase [Pseudocolwellia agarivorans]